MNDLGSIKSHLWRMILVGTLGAAFGSIRAQSTAEYAGSTSMAASTAARTKTIGISVANKAPSVSGKSALVVPVGPPPDVVNRNALEQRAGKDAGKLLVRSTPSGARIWINGMFVGNTPLLLILAPGKYQVEVQAQRFESARQVVALLPRETREMALRMAVRYPTTVSIH